MAKKSNAHFLRYLRPVVESLKELGYSARPKQVLETIQKHIHVPPEEIDTIQKSGQSRFENNVHWARLYLAKTGYIDSSKRGVWNLTSKGADATIDEELVEKIFRAVQDETRQQRESDTELADADDQTLDEIEESLDEHDHRGETLKLLKEMKPASFERFCKALLLESGFEEVIVTGQSGDRGVDGHGTLRINPFVTLTVMFQCKRYKDSISPSYIRDFRGALTGRADRGLFITTGIFTRESELEASREGVTPIELVDGMAIVRLMEDFEFGLHPITTYRIDPQFLNRFDE